ncbi:MAG: hypothetical protein PHH51_00695 [Bacilli bacterium]|nr:hypothetical protein [Bacilli bacterium]MDD3896016.1 hypothetical protein [Bacilli bacterium]MDD4407493.1 hypothetical protein [Bacilli bacterium]
MKKEIVISAKKVKHKKRVVKTLKLILLFILLFLLLIYLVFALIYKGGSFSVNLDRELYIKNNIIIYDDPDYKVFRSELFAETISHFDNISGTWLPDNINERSNGSHNGENFVAYTFYIENLGSEIADYWSEIVIDDVIKNVDDAIRIRVYKNGEVITYAKMSRNNTLEKDTISFTSDTLVARDHVQNFAPGNRDKYTIVLWLEGTDPECTDNILGGQIKIHMDFKSEIIK